jgi:Retinoic acid induced 16-like protein.
MEAEEKETQNSFEEKPFVDKESLQNLEKNWQNVENLLKRTQGDFKELSLELSSIVHEIVDIIGPLSKLKDFENDVCKFCNKNNLFNRIYNWTGQHRECLRLMAEQQLQIYNKLVKNASTNLLMCEKVIIPLLLLLMSLKPAEKRKVPPTMQKLYVNILYCISERITSIEFLDLLSKDLFTEENFKIPKFTFFELLILYTHEIGESGDLTRKAILFCIQSSSSHQLFQKYITEESAVSVVSKISLI